MASLSSPPDGFPTSPCIQVCTLDDASMCMGCRRSLHEIVNWARMSAEEQRAVIRELPTRGRSDT